MSDNKYKPLQNLDDELKSRLAQLKAPITEWLRSDDRIYVGMSNQKVETIRKISQD